MKLRRHRRATSTLRDARRALQAQVDYWETRIFYGDPLFDQWMVDALGAARDGVTALDKLEALGADTGRETIRPATPHHYTTVGIDLRALPNATWEPTYVLDGRARLTRAARLTGTRQEAFAQARADFQGPKVSAETVFVAV